MFLKDMWRYRGPHKRLSPDVSEGQTETITITQTHGRLLSQQRVCRRNPHMKTSYRLQVFISIMC